MSGFAHFLNWYFIEDSVINLQFFISINEDFGCISLKMIGPSSTEANDTYTCIPFKLMS